MKTVAEKDTGVTVSVIIPARNAESTLRQALEPLLPPPEGWEIVLVDDGSTDETPALARSMGVPVICSEGSGNDYAARNTGARFTKGSILVFLDSDVVTNIPDLMRTVKRLLEDDPGCIFAVYDCGDHLQNTVSRYKNFWIRHSTLRARRPLRWVNASLAILRRHTFNQAGGFTEYFSYRFGGGDLDFGYQIASNVGPVVADETLQVAHLKYFTLRRLWLNELRRAQGWLCLALTRGGLFSVVRNPSLANVSSRFSWGIVATAAGTFFALLAPFATIFALFALAALVMSLMLNFSFFKDAFRQRIRGLPLFIPLLWFDQIACAAGICKGLTTFVLSRECSLRRLLVRGKLS